MNARIPKRAGPRQWIKTLLWNIEGIKNASSILPDNYFLDYDIVILTETMLTTEWTINGMYTIHHFATQQRLGRPKGGITCILQASLSPFVTLYSSEHILLVKTTAFTVAGAYFQPDTPAMHIIDEMGIAMSKVDPDSPLILAGDLNCRID